MNAVKSVALAVVFLLSALVPAINVDAGNDARTDTDTGYLSEKWRAGLGTGLGALNSIKSADIDADGEDELVFGNSQGYVHVLDWNASAGAFSEEFQSVDMGGAVKGMEIAQIDDDPQLEIAIGYNWNSDSGKVKIIDGISLLAEANWSSGVSWSHTQWTEGWPYGIAMGDLDGDNQTELGMSADRGFLWVVDTNTPEIYVGRDITGDEAEWYMDVGAKTGGNTLENTWGLTFGQFDDDEAMEVAIGSKQGWVAIFDGETEEMQWKMDMDGNNAADSLCYSMIAADLNGNGIDELVVPQQSKITVFIDGDRDVRVDDTDVKSGYGLDNVDLFGNDNEELIVADSSGNIRIMSLSSDESSLITHQEWNSGYTMNAGGGVTVSMNGHDNPWIIHGGDAGVLVAWEIPSQSQHSLVWKSESGSNGDQTLYSLEGGNNYAVAMGNIDDDDNLEILVGAGGSGSGRVYAFDGKTYETDWVSPNLNKLPMGIAVGDLNNDGDNEIVVTTGIPGEPMVEGEGGDGYLHIFERNGGGTFSQAFQSGNIDAALGVTIVELDGSTYPEIGIATGYLEIVDATSGTTDLHGEVRIWGYGGSSYSEEWSSGDLEQIVGGIDSGDPDGDGDNELVIGTGGDNRGSNQDTAEVRVYHHLGGTYALDGSVIDAGRYYAFGIDVGDVDNDGEEEITVGTGEYGENKPRLSVYDGSSHSVEYSKSVDSSSVWGVRSGDFDSDGFAELIYGTSGGELFIYDGETEDFEAKTSALSGKAGHYGGIAIGNANGEGPMEMVVGSTGYMWLFTTEGETNKPDLAIEGTEIFYSPEEPDEDEDILINMSIINYGGSDTAKWRVKIYDGDPDAGGKKLTEFSCDATQTDQRDGCKALSSGESASFEIIWYGIQTDPGYHELYGLAEDTNSPRQETRFSNNKDFTTIEIEEIPNDRPVIVASTDKTVLWVDEAVRIDAGDSYDNETTDNQADRTDSDADLGYRYYFDGSWTSWMSDYTWDVSFSSPGMKEIKVVARDERRKESEELIITVEVKANTQPVAVLTSNSSEIVEGGFVTFDLSQSYDPDDRAELEYRFSFGDAVYSDWVAEGQTVRLYQNAFFNGPNGGELQIDSGEEVLRDNFGITRVFKLMNGQLLEIKDSVPTNNGYNYSLPETSDERTYTAQLMAREISESGNDDILASSWSDPVAIKVYRAENIPPIAVAKAGIFMNGVGVFNDIVDFAKTGDVITYSAAESYDPDGDDTLMTYEWRLIDSRGGNINLLGDKYEKTFERTYNEPGTYTAILTVTDERGGYSTWQVDVIVTKSDTTSTTGGGDEGYDTITLFGAAFIAIAGLVGGAIALNRMRGGDDLDDMFEDVIPGPMELQCPSCGGLISITTTQRPIQVGCPICASQFVLRE
ncbi:MAG: PKD domain-containing protein [Candidatus Poseidoniia archaeon]|nr:PKD domain-containing protein [Candidatus Poseidoniia archaeon]